MMEKLTKSHLIIISIIIVVNFIIVFWHVQTEFIKDMYDYMLLILDGNIYFFSFYNPGFWIYYRPIPLYFILFIYLIWGMNAVPYHVVTIILNVSICLLIYALSLRVFKNQFVASVSVMGFLLASGIYYQVYFWVACYFYLFYALFLLLGIYCYLNYYFSEDKRIYWFLLVIVFSSLALLSNEAAIFTIIAFPVFELFDNKLGIFFKKKIWKYFGFIPILAVFLLAHLITGRGFAAGAGELVWVYIIPAAIIFLASSVLVYLYMRKRDSQDKLFIILAYLSTFVVVVMLEPRSFYFPCITYGLLVGIVLIKSKYPDILNFLKTEVFTSRFSKKKVVTTLGVAVLMALSMSSLIVNGFLWIRMGGLVSSLSNQIIQEVDEPQIYSIYILDTPYIRTIFITVGKYDINRAILAKKRIDYDVELIVVGTSGGVTPHGAVYINETQYNSLSNNSLNVIFQCDPWSFRLKNVSGLNYSQL